jgi:hypothetical protein
MADKKISELTELTTPDGTEELVVNDSGVSKKITQANLLRGINNTAADATAITIDASENVGIGTNSPDTKLHVDGGDVKISSDVQSSNGDGIPTIFFGEDTTALVAAQISYHGDDESGDNNFIGIGCNGATPASEAVTKENHQMVIKASGNIGIGTSSPDHTLRVNGDTRLGNLHVKTSEYTGGTGKSIWADNAGTGVLGLNSSTSIQMNAGGSERMRVTTDGLTFNGDTAAANALDDYEEGDWDSEVGGTATYGVNQARYTKIGRQVIATFDLNITTIGTGSTTVVTGLPFAVGDSIAEGVSVSFFDGLATSVVFLTAYAINSEIRFRALTAAGTGLTDASVLGSGCRVTGTVSYTV